MKLNFEQPTPKAHKTINADVLAQLEQQSDNSISTTFTDPPYFLGSEWHYVNGILQIKGNGKDFMGAWEIQNATWWRTYFKLLFQKMKYGGYVVFYSISQQSWAFSALMVEAGFEKCQELHWANISNFPKSSAADKQIDKRLGAENKRKKIGERKGNYENNNRVNDDGWQGRKNENGLLDITAPYTDLAKLFDGYKYGKAPLKKITEPILVFRKPCKFGSVLNDLMACQTDSEISPAVLDIERNRVGLSEADKEATIARAGYKDGVSHVMKANKDLKFSTPLVSQIDHNPLAHVNSGRFPATLFISPEAAELLDSQLDLVTFELNGKIHTTKRLEYQRLVSLHVLNNTFESCKVLGVKREVMKSTASEANHEPSNSAQNARQVTPRKSDVHFGDSGYISRVLHQPDFTEADYCQYSLGIHEDTFYCATVSHKERKLGVANNENTHPTMKPIALNKFVSSLFLQRKEFNQVLYIPFSGSGSEVIGAIMAGYNIENIISVEINPKFVEIQDERVNFYLKEGKQKN